ncbi:MAG: glycoside hydrolase family 57 protein [Candidatus Aminicenantes bacterium]|nr:glycoside hydrolase family 57 protein [Candidatus Aminicenantes bacterium]
MRVAILWHFHQPIYRKPGSFEYVMPWVNFHLKNYHQMIRIAEETGFPCTFNLVPCLLEQIRDYVENRAVDPVQAALEKDPEELTENDLARLRRFAPGEGDPEKIQETALRAFLSPIDPLPATKDGLLERQKSVLRGLLPGFARMGRERRAELTATPYYHPLTPLIFDLRVAFGQILPRETFRYPDDARHHLETAGSYFEEVFGFRPAGLWPSEGGVSKAVTKTAADAGFPFAVTDENILWKSLGVAPKAEFLRTPYRSEGLPIFFRDRVLSDLIGFEYNCWNPREAAADLVRRIAERRAAGPDDILVLALDGENPWPFYADNGVSFIREFYGLMLRTEGIQPSFFSDILHDRRDDLRDIDLAPGTWLGNFSKWIGDAAKNEGWNILSRARRDCGPIEEILIAEGSDWFWWRGEAHPEFEVLFLEYIAAAYRAKGLPVPEECRPRGYRE